MPDVLPLTTDEALSLVKTQAPKYMKGASDMTFRRRLWMGMLQQYGTIEANADSFSCTWDTEAHQPEVTTYGDSGDLSFPEHDAFEQYTIDVAGYKATDRWTLKKRQMNRGQGQIIDVYGTKSERLVKRMRQVLCGELYTDGGASGNAERWDGIETLLSNNSSNVTQADKIGFPNDTYAGRSTALGADSGGVTWSTDLAAADRPNAALAVDFPYGQGPSSSDHSTPLLVNYNSTAWDTGSTDWASNCAHCMRFARVLQSARGAKDGNERVPFMHMLASDLYEEFLRYNDAQNRVLIPHRDADRLGFGDTLNWEGDMVHYEYDTPAGKGYGISPIMMEVFHLSDQLIQVFGPEWSIEKAAYLYFIVVFGNLRFQPKFFVKYDDFVNNN